MPVTCSPAYPLTSREEGVRFDDALAVVPRQVRTYACRASRPGKFHSAAGIRIT